MPDSFARDTDEEALAMVMTSDSLASLLRRVAAAELDIAAAAERAAETRARVRATRQRVRSERTGREIVREDACARLLERLESMPVIEQAKGIIMAQSGCRSEEASAILRSASQRSNVEVRDLAAQIVTEVSSSAPPPGNLDFPRLLRPSRPAARQPHRRQLPDQQTHRR